MAEAETTDWGAWSKDAVRLMQERNAAWQQRFALPDGSRFLWDMKTATIQFRRNTDQVVASVCVVGTTSEREGTFLWAWANESIPAIARKRLEQVRDFGTRHQLELLTTPEFPGSRAEALEMLAVAGRVLDAEGVFIHPVGDITHFFALSDFRIDHKL
jgi:hypothetical protein